MRSRDGSPQVVQQIRAEDIPLENLSRSSTPVLGGKPNPIAISSTVNAALQLRNSPKRNSLFDNGGISVSSSPATSSILGSSYNGQGGSGSPVGILGVSSSAVGQVAVVSQETSFMGGPEGDEETEEVAQAVVVEEDGQQQQQMNQSKRKGTIETV